ncbi:MAG TPA: class D sortase [Vicinamibacteria bacterium]|nr:class D sortase [Vicinamibacteria bacterium]
MWRFLEGHPVVAWPGGRFFAQLVRVSASWDVRCLEHVLTGAGIALIGLFGMEAAATHLYQSVEGFRLGLERAAIESGNLRIVSEESRSEAMVAERYSNGQTIATIEVARIGLFAVVSEGDDPRILARSVGHVPGTAFPGERGNVGLAAHRDGLFRELRRIRTRDEIRLVTRDRVHAYSVTAISVVRPEQIEVLDPTHQPSLTLVTCYPFGYVGTAPYRFIVRAREVSTRPLGP